MRKRQKKKIASMQQKQCIANGIEIERLVKIFNQINKALNDNGANEIHADNIDITPQGIEVRR